MSAHHQKIKIFPTLLSDNNVYFNASLPYISVGNVPGGLPLCPVNLIAVVYNYRIIHSVHYYLCLAALA